MMTMIRLFNTQIKIIITINKLIAITSSLKIMNNLMTIKLGNELRMIGLFDTLIKIIIMIINQ